MSNNTRAVSTLNGLNVDLRAEKMAEKPGLPAIEAARDVLILNTGGTIGMVPGPEGLQPGYGVLEQAVAELAQGPMTVRVHAFEPIVDSAEIGPADWNRMIDLVLGFRGDGVIITHGTDTMAFTGAALSHALAGLDLPVILCGSMKPLGTGGDAEANLSLALDAVSRYLKGVWLAFDGRLLPAAGLVKHNSKEADAFRSVPQIPLPPRSGPRHFADLDLAILTLTPFLSAKAIAAMLSELDGAVLRVFGSGTMPSDPNLEAVIAEAVRRGCRIRAVSQCETGGVEPGTYAAGAALWRAGVENGGLETPEAALARLWLELSAEQD
ncbi:asparaginase domain-containing protein [Rhizobium lemnae]|uniref:Asparaginase domain-containing protein n=1 Tax=Rhizobium lemnae TaxID=1214924 RepID=A0ABV8EDZ4_9HYPH|nr:asparaginase domain-containing protein [Rhizobium lemnae]MCJ8510544.1 asparaginase domain-containing protein [Rhizobium lemnae]